MVDAWSASGQLFVQKHKSPQTGSINTLKKLPNARRNFLKKVGMAATGSVVALSMPGVCASAMGAQDRTGSIRLNAEGVFMGGRRRRFKIHPAPQPVFNPVMIGRDPAPEYAYVGMPQTPKKMWTL